MDGQLYIESIEIRNYKSMVDSGNIIFDSHIFALIGQNNTGKSTILDAIQCFHPEIKKTVELRDYHSRSKSVEINVSFAGVSNEYIAQKMFADDLQKYEEKHKDLILNNARPDEIAKYEVGFAKKIEEKIFSVIKKYEIEEEQMKVKLTVPITNGIVGKKAYSVESGNTISETDLKKILPTIKVIPAIRNPQNESSAGTNSYMKDLIQMLDDGIETSIEVSGNKVNYNDLNRIIADASNYRCSRLSSEITRKYSEVIGNDDFEIHISSDVNISKGTTYSTKLLDKHSNLESDMLNCGTGYQSMIILAILQTYLELENRQCGYIIIIEEPEVYLHPTLQRKMIEAMCNLSVDNQVLFSTHSPITISALKKEQVRIVIKEGAEARLEEINTKQVIRELGIRPEDILMGKGVILVEGPDDAELIKILVEKFKPGYSEQINIVSTGSCSKLAFFANAQRIFSGAYEVPVLIIRDADCLNVEEQKEALCSEIVNVLNERDAWPLEKIQESVFVVGEHSIESLFIDSAILSKISGYDIGRCEKVCETYLTGYSKASDLKNKNILCNYFQPKYFFEKKLDEYGWSEKKAEARKKWDDAYYKRWEEILQICFPGEDERFSEFKELRESVNEYTRISAMEQRNYLVDIAGEISIEMAKHNKFANLFSVLEAFVEKTEK